MADLTTTRNPIDGYVIVQEWAKNKNLTTKVATELISKQKLKLAKVGDVFIANEAELNLALSTQVSETMNTRKKKSEKLSEKAKEKKKITDVFEKVAVDKTIDQFLAMSSDDIKQAFDNYKKELKEKEDAEKAALTAASKKTS